MEIWHGFTLGVVQGSTEFFPVSSSGHLLLIETWLGLTPDINFSILLHTASLLAVILVYRKEIAALAVAAFRISALKNDIKSIPANTNLAWQLLAATGLTAGGALLIEPYFKTLLTLNWVALTLIITGFLILISAQTQRQARTIMSWKLALALGLVQGLAVIPGISRSGLTIAFLMLVGLNRQRAVQISFLLSIPTILGALVFMIKDQWGSFNFGIPALIGFVISFITAWITILLMHRLVDKHWWYFAPYCFVLGGGILVLSFGFFR